MPATAPAKARTIAPWSLRILLGLIFFYIGYTKLSGTGNTIDYFAAINWGQWFRYLTGVLDVTGAALLFIPRLTSYGAILLACSAGIATLISFTVLHGNPIWGTPPMVVIPFVLTSLAAILAWLTRLELKATS